MKDFAFTQEEADEADLVLIARNGKAHWGSRLSLPDVAALLRQIADDVEFKATRGELTDER